MHSLKNSGYRYGYFVFLSCALMISLVGCEKEITVDLPSAEQKIVVEGTIYNDQPPVLFLSWTQGYFEPTSLADLANLYIRDPALMASIEVDGVTYPLTLVCISDLPANLQLEAATALGISIDVLLALDLCAYTSLDLIGEAGKQYRLKVDYLTHHLTCDTKIPELVALDSVWFEIVSSLPDDSLGFLFANITDPDTLGNSYRWFAKRINHYPSWFPEYAGQQKDGAFIAPLGSTNDDQFFNGLSFEFGYFRGSAPNSTKDDDLNEERGFYKRGDTVVVRGACLDRKAFQFISGMEDQTANQGSPFAVPYNLASTVEGGLGAFIGYAASYDTVICQ
jgi:Domain of unknown function (DUF4249)